MDVFYVLTLLNSLLCDPKRCSPVASPSLQTLFPVERVNVRDMTISRLFDGKTLRRKFPRLFDESRRTIRRYTIRRRDYSTVYYSTERLFDGKTIRRKDHSTEICLICLHTAMGQINVLSICIHDCIQVWKKYLLFTSLQDVQKKLKDLPKSSDNSVVFQVWCK